jgi:hypothetical protein
VLPTSNCAALTAETLMWIKVKNDNGNGNNNLTVLNRYAVVSP